MKFRTLRSSQARAKEPGRGLPMPWSKKRMAPTNTTERTSIHGAVVFQKELPLHKPHARENAEMFRRRPKNPSFGFRTDCLVAVFIRLDDAPFLVDRWEISMEISSHPQILEEKNANTRFEGRPEGFRSQFIRPWP
jgi:hypothetical protein